jgi:SAM-dependent MidA family methyltransferase
MQVRDIPRLADVTPDDVSREAYLPWADAWAQALYGPDGFYRRPEGPAGHFRTASHAAPGLLAAAVTRLARIGGCTAVVDIGAGRGELLGALADLGDLANRANPANPANPAGVADGRRPDAAGLALHGCDVVDRPAALRAEIGWSTGIDALPDAVLDGALVIGWELLDVVPCPVVEVDPDGAVRTVLVDPVTGAEMLGPPVDGADARWLARWWPLDGSRSGDQPSTRPGDPPSTRPGARAEVGHPRDVLWSGLVSRCRQTPRGAVLLAVDYAHTRSGRPALGSLVGYRAGRLVPPVPDGRCDLTAHVALDAVAAATTAAGAATGVLLRQRDALRALGIGTATGLLTVGASAAAPASPASAQPAPSATLAALAARSAAAELLDTDGLGGFSWLLQAVGRPQPALPNQPAPPTPPGASSSAPDPR